jgi:hypothetical protein
LADTAAGEDGEGVEIKARMAIERREFRVGERVVFNPDEFSQIGLGCWAFADRLGRKLPKADAAAP